MTSKKIVSEDLGEAVRVEVVDGASIPHVYVSNAVDGIEVALTDAELRASPVNTANPAGTQVDGHSVTIGATTDADSANTVVGRLKKIVALLGGGLPAALGSGGGLKASLVDLGGAATAAKQDAQTSELQDIEQDVASVFDRLGDGSQKAIARAGAKGATSAADVTSTAEGVDHQALDVQAYHGGAAIDPRDVSDRAGRALGVVTGPLTDEQLRASAVPVSDGGGSLTVDTPQLPSALVGGRLDIRIGADGAGLATSAAQTDGSQKTQVTSLPALPAGANTIGKVDQGTGGASAWKVDGSAVTQPVSAASLPLPAGASTSALQTTANSSLASIDGKLATEKVADFDTTGSTDNVALKGIALPSATGAVVGGTSSNPLRTDPTGTTTQPISAASLPLPDGAATAANQATANASLASLDGKSPALVSGRVPVDGSGVTQPISAVSLPLPSGAATSALQSTGNTSLASIDGKLPANPATDRTTAAAPFAARLTDGSAFYKATTPADTQPTSSAASSQVDGHSATIGATTDASSASTVVGRLKKIVELLNGGLPSTLGTSGGLKTSLVDLGGAATDTVLQAVRDRLPSALVDGAFSVAQKEYPAYWALFPRIAVPTNNVYLATLFNTSATTKIVIQRMWAPDWQTVLATGFTLDHEIRRITSRTAGAAASILSLDTADVLPAGISADTGSTSVGGSTLLMRMTNTASSINNSSNGAVQFRVLTPDAIFYERKPGVRPIVLRQNQGITIYTTSSAEVGTVSFIYEFTVEPV